MRVVGDGEAERVVGVGVAPIVAVRQPVAVDVGHREAGGALVAAPRRAELEHPVAGRLDQVELDAALLRTDHDVSGPTQTDHDVSGPAQVDDDVSGPTQTDDDVSGPTQTDDDVSGPAQTDDDVSGPTQTDDDVSGPTQTDDDVSGPTQTDHNFL